MAAVERTTSSPNNRECFICIQVVGALRHCELHPGGPGKLLTVARAIAPAADLHGATAGGAPPGSRQKRRGRFEQLGINRWTIQQFQWRHDPHNRNSFPCISHSQIPGKSKNPFLLAGVITIHPFNCCLSHSPQTTMGLNQLSQSEDDIILH